MLLSKEQILSKEDRKFEDVEVPEWGGSVRIAEMSGLARNRFEMSLLKYEKGAPVFDDGEVVQDLEGYDVKLLAACIVDEEFKPLFTVEELGNKNGKIISRLQEVATRINAVAIDSVEEAAKN